MKRGIGEMIKLEKKWADIPREAKVSIAYAVCSILQRCLSFITLPLFTRLLTTTEYGQFTVYQSWSGILSIFLTLNLAYGSFSTAMVKFENDRDGYISSVEGICLALALAFLIIYLPFHSAWNKLFELPTLLICVMIAEILGAAAIMLWSGKERFDFKYKNVIGITLGISFLSPALAYVFVVNTNEKGYARILGYATVTILVGCFFYIKNALRGKKLFNKVYWKYALGFNIPLLVYYLSQVIFNQSDRIMISHMVGTDKAAIYGVAYSLAMILTFVLNAINNSYIPWFYGKMKEEKQNDNRKISLGIAAIMALLIMLVIWFAPEIILVMAGRKYAEAVYVVPPVAISLLLLFYSQLFINVEFYFEEKKKLVWASIAAAIANLILNWIFIRIIGFVAAAYTTLFSYVLFVLCNYVAMKRVLIEKKIEDKAYNYRGLIVLFVMLCVVSASGVLLYNALYIRIILLFVVFIVVVIFRERIWDIYKSIKKKG